MRRLALILSLTIGFALIAASCGSDDDSTEAGSTTDDTGDTADEPTDDSADTADAGDSTDDAPLGAGPYPIADVTFVVDVTETEEEPVTYRLACLGDTATFTGDGGGLDAAAACLALNDDEVRDRLTTEQHLDRICTEIYGGPEIAIVTGTLDDLTIDTEIGRNNGCGIDDWDRLLVALLLPAAA